MGVFAIAAGAELFRAAAIAAAYDLGVFIALDRAMPVDELADAIAITRGRHRVRALIDALVMIGVLARDGEALTRGVVPERPEVVRAGWGRLADVIRSDRPLPLAHADPAYHRHLVTAGSETARELAPLLSVPSLLDLGGGAGAYTEGFLDAHPAATATLADFDEVLAFARDHLARFGERVRFIAGDARTVALGDGHGAAVLANVVHLHGPDVCAALCTAAARAVAPGGAVAILDLRADSPEGVWFALNMALYTERGSVYPTARLRSWLAGAGLVALTEHRLAAAPECVVVLGRRPPA